MIVNGRVQDVPHDEVQYVRQQLGLQVCAIATLDDLVGYLQVQTTPGMAEHLAQVRAYRERYGVAG